MKIEDLLYQITGQSRETALEAQLRELRREVRRASHSVAKLAGHAGHDLGDNLSDFRREAGKYGAELSDNLSDFGREAGKYGAELSREAARRGAEFAEVAAYQAGRGARALQRDPVPAIAIVATAVLLARLLDRR